MPRARRQSSGQHPCLYAWSQGPLHPVGRLHASRVPRPVLPAHACAGMGTRCFIRLLSFFWEVAPFLLHGLLLGYQLLAPSLSPLQGGRVTQA